MQLNKNLLTLPHLALLALISVGVPIIIIPTANAQTSGPVDAGTASLSFDPAYDDGARPLAHAMCSLLPYTHAWNTFSDVPAFPFLAAAPAPFITSPRSADCGTCFELTWRYGKRPPVSVNVVVVDKANGAGAWVVSRRAMDALTGGHALEFGRISVEYKRVREEVCEARR